MTCNRAMSALLVGLLCFLLALPLAARDVTVKYRPTPVDVSSGHFEELPLKPSSLVKEIFYDAGSEYLLVRLKETFYHYYTAPESRAALGGRAITWPALPE